MRVSIVESSVSAMTDSQGRFVLRSVPAGDAPLEFVGSSVNARLQLGTVSELEGSCPHLRFTVGSRRIATNGDTEYVGGSCSQVAAGANVLAYGPLNGSTINARVVQFEAGSGSGEAR